MSESEMELPEEASHLPNEENMEEEQTLEVDAIVEEVPSGEEAVSIEDEFLLEAGSGAQDTSQDEAGDEGLASEPVLEVEVEADPASEAASELVEEEILEESVVSESMESLAEAERTQEDLKLDESADEVEPDGDAPELVEVSAEAEPETESLEAVDEEDEEATIPLDDRAWYVVHCYSGYENKVRHNLEQRIETMGMKNKIFDVVVPTEEEIEVKDGKRKTVERRVFPGYILVQMLMDEDSWYVVRNTPGVTGFVGMGNDPTPLRPEEVSQIVKRMEAEAPRIKVTYSIGQKVRIIDGPFNDFIGTVSDIDMERAKVRVMVSFFGRETPVELDFLQVEKA